MRHALAGDRLGRFAFLPADLTRLPPLFGGRAHRPPPADWPVPPPEAARRAVPDQRLATPPSPRTPQRRPVRRAPAPGWPTAPSPQRLPRPGLRRPGPGARPAGRGRRPDRLPPPMPCAQPVVPAATPTGRQQSAASDAGTTPACRTPPGRPPPPDPRHEPEGPAAWPPATPGPRHPMGLQPRVAAAAESAAVALSAGG